MNILAFWKSILRLAAGLIIPVACGWGMVRWIETMSIAMLVGGIVVYTVVYCCSMWFVGMNTYEKKLIIKPVQKIIRRGK